jgi:hypothetical protein
MSNGIGGIAGAMRRSRACESGFPKPLSHDEKRWKNARCESDRDAGGKPRCLCQNHPESAHKTPGMRGKVDAIIESRLGAQIVC